MNVLTPRPLRRLLKEYRGPRCECRPSLQKPGVGARHRPSAGTHQSLTFIHSLFSTNAGMRCPYRAPRLRSSDGIHQSFRFTHSPRMSTTSPRIRRFTPDNRSKL